jgi:hypothetical protein
VLIHGFFEKPDEPVGCFRGPVFVHFATKLAHC